MKKQTTLTSASHYFFARLFACMITIGSVSFASAQDSIDQPELKYMGSLNGKVVFELGFQSTGKESFLVEIIDQDGYELYREKSRDRHFKKQFAIEKTDLENNIISVLVTSKGRLQKFDINRSMRMVEDIRIVRQ